MQGRAVLGGQAECRAAEGTWLMIVAPEASPFVALHDPEDLAETTQEVVFLARKVYAPLLEAVLAAAVLVKLIVVVPVTLPAPGVVAAR